MKHQVLILLLALSPLHQSAKADMAPHALFDAAKLQHRQGHLDSAEAKMEKVLETLHAEKTTGPVLAEAHFELGKILESQAQASSIFSAPGYGKRALKHYLKAVSLEPKNSHFRKILIKFYLDAPGIAGGDIDEGLAQANILFQQDKKHGYRALAKAYAKDGDRAKVLETYKQALVLDPNDAELYYQRGHYFLSQDEFEAAVKEFQSAIALPKLDNHQIAIQLQALYYIGRTSSISGQKLERGIQAFLQYLEQYQPIEGETVPDPHWARFRMAQLMTDNGQSQDAKAVYLSMLDDPELDDKELVTRIKDQL